MSIKIYSFYNNKGGVGKTTLCSNASTLYAKNNPDKQVLVIDMCPQANISQFLLGGGRAGYETNQRIQSQATRKNIVGFIAWLLDGNANFKTPNTKYRIKVSRYNEHISDNLYLIAGDSFLESLSLALNYAVVNPANTNAWKEYMTSLKRLCEHELDKKKYDEMTVFIDCNPSFSIYTQIALVSSDYLIVPMMADFSSIEGIKGILMMLYGEYPSVALKKYADNILTFNKQVINFNLKLPILYEFVFNNFTVKIGIATAYGSIKKELIEFCFEQYKKFPKLFRGIKPPSSSDDWSDDFVSDVKDFHTAGKVSASLGIPLHKLPDKNQYKMPDGSMVMLTHRTYDESLKNITDFVDRIS